MLTDKEQKKQFKLIASRNYEQYYVVDFLNKEGFSRFQCFKCNTYFWSTKQKETCGDSLCSGGFTFMKKKLAKNSLDYIQVWKKFSQMFRNLGYEPINRYPVVARWNPTMTFTIASIAAFQPYVVSGEVEPPFKKLVIPQFCLRFSDIDNVGLTGAHFTNFIMIGQHQFVEEDEWDQEECFKHLYGWFVDGMGLSKDDFVLHEDAWAGGGNFGPCMEFFSGGLEIANQVYMMYEQTPDGDKKLRLKVLDMGMGHERVAWFTQGTLTAYEATFPTVCKKLKEITKVEVDEHLIRKFMAYAGYLNLDEIDDIEHEWERVAKEVGVSKESLKEKILPLQGLYSIAEHSRALLVALSDGALPSNVGGEYNLRILFRRALGFIDKFNWNIKLFEVCKWHAEYLEPLFPELLENLESVKKILEIEEQKYKNTKEKSKQILNKLLQSHITVAKLIEIYDSQGIPPELVVMEAKRLGKEIRIPENFYALVSERHDKKEQVHQTKKLEIKEFEFLPPTKALYYGDYLDNLEFNAQVLDVKDNYVVLDQTCFYPTSGGQINDIGRLDSCEVVDVFKQNDKIVHEIKGTLKKGKRVYGFVDRARREQLAKHHTATHIINNAARKILGNHVNQAGAKKTFDKAHIDITHYQSLSESELNKIENLANEVVSKSLKVNKSFMKRFDAERKYGMDIYQGGAIPGKELRIVNIEGWDVECCGGTHLNNTSEVGNIKILRSNKISDSVVRIEFVAGLKALESEESKNEIVTRLTELLSCNEDGIPARCNELFNLWKMVIKKKKKLEFKLVSEGNFKGDVVKECARILKTQPEHIVRTIKRFIDEIGKF
ncbi:alanine--tRNA ligase [Candidatus Woesearchaeota archaeon]|nr:alanine--tRNA ligase [Candidatus Woesearchaeota archaeon]